MEQSKKFLSKKIVALSMVGCLAIPFFSTTASAELSDKTSHNSNYKCTLVIDKNKNDIMYIKGNPNYGKGKTFSYTYAKGKGCMKGSNFEVRGFYFNSPTQKYAFFDGIYKNDVRYSGEKTYLPSPGLKIDGKKVSGVVVATYVTDSAKKITGKKMNVVYTQYLRAKPKVDSKKLAKVYQDKTIVKVKKVSGAWAYVYSYTSKSYGWMPRKYVISEVTVNRIVEKTVKPKVRYIESSAIEEGTKKIIRKGKASKYTYIYKDNYKNGKKISTKLYKKYLDVEGYDTRYELGV